MLILTTTMTVRIGILTHSKGFLMQRRSFLQSSLAVLGSAAAAPGADAATPRLLNLRIYESHNERAGRKKIEMFNKSELAIFRRVGLTPVLFAETILGVAMPNLTYMLVFPDEAGRAAAWNRFRDDAEW